ncbi:Pre-mRNA-splicing factor ATP-dependent RNA helicase DHX16 [Histomonas meleagridis]|uniref:Pre-mRNA-splicing factor ATP-dependent RNA helicase DHX16 n=1 Tax=Histomonas meleagridis TaxID=135588 RepID=UPI0035593A3D|nr:Pre-mRNA-splicing factor ATP-dependent RNA helicase DHX16 [Histomonas meleagridis]KAH0801921.1 Pre-mRNA-splicing factor ATP-dependent RNA helicase DHX16 [Histomonas meleagridis]
MNQIDRLREESRRAYLAKRAQEKAQERQEYIRDHELLQEGRKLSEIELREIELDKGILQMTESINRNTLQPEYRINQSPAVGDTLKERLANISKQYVAQEANNPMLKDNSSWETQRLSSAGISSTTHLVFDKPDSDVIAPPPEFDFTPIQQSLPVYKYKRELLEAVDKFPILIVVGDTGSGKTTQIPQYLLERGPNESIVCTQPRRVAAMSVAKRVAEERHCELGWEVGYCVRFENVTSDLTKIRYMTDGLLLREFLVDPLLSKYTTIMIDEAHERSIPTDLLLSLLKDLSIVRPELRLIIASATLDADKMSNFFGGAPVLHVPGRRFSVDINYSEQTENDYEYASLLTALHIHRTTPIEQPCDILVFLTGQDEIDNCVSQITLIAKNNGMAPLIALPIYAALPGEKQAKIFMPAPKGTRKVIFATNIAETSITIDTIKYVIDCGYVKQTSYDPKVGIESLYVVPISVSSASQRAGRAGRVTNGVCYRLFTNSAYEHEMPKVTKPEILRCNFAPTLLLLLSIGIQTIIDFNFMDPPPLDNITAAYEQLYAMYAIDSETHLTVLGSQMVQIPVSPFSARTIIESYNLKCSTSVIIICSILESGSPIFYLPKEDKKDAETTIKGFYDNEGDHITLLNVYRAWEQSQYSRQWCVENRVQYRTLMKAKDIKEQIEAVCKLMGFENDGEEDEKLQSISKAFTYGFFQNAAQLCNDGTYKTIRGDVQVSIHPGSSLKGTSDPPKFVVFYELARTSKVYMRTVIRIDPMWLKEAAPHIYKVINGVNVKVTV